MSKIQNYISSELTHFVGRSLSSDDERYNLFVNIIKSGIIRGKIDNGKGSTMTQCDPNINFSSNESFNPNIVCFCDIPYDDFNVHMKKYSYFGLSFTKDFLISQGVRPVYYVPRAACVTNINISDYFDQNIKRYSELSVAHTMHYINKLQQGELHFSEGFQSDIFHFFDLQILSFVKFFDHDKVDDDPDNYYMEREWRGLERIDFQIPDVYRIILPANYIKRFFQDFPEYNSHLTTT